MNRTLMRENAFRLLYSLEVQKNKEINIEEQIELYIESNNITNTEAIEYMKDAILGIEKNKVEIKSKIKLEIRKNIKNRFKFIRTSNI